MALARRLHKLGVRTRAYSPTGYGPKCWGVAAEVRGSTWYIAAYYDNQTEDSVVADAEQDLTRDYNDPMAYSLEHWFR